MRFRIIVVCAALICLAASAGAQQSTASQAGAQSPVEQRAQLDAQAVAFDAEGREAIGARLRTTQLQGSVDSPVRNIRLVVENRTTLFYTFVSGWATFYDAGGVRCGEGMFNLSALAAGESAETDAPGLRLTCAPSSWRIVATNLLTRTSDAAKPTESRPASTPAVQPFAETPAPAVVPLEITINGEVHPVQLNNPLNIRVGQQRVQIVVRRAP